MDVQALYRIGQKHRKRNAKQKFRSHQSKYKILELLIEKGPATSEELASLLTMSVHSVSKAAQSLTTSGFIVRIVQDGHRMAITPNGIRVTEVAQRERQQWSKCDPNPEIVQAPPLRNIFNTG